MNNTEKVKRLQSLCLGVKHVDCFYKDLEDMGDLKTNYYDYMTTELINCKEELKRVSEADYELCAALLTMLLREDHFSNGSFEARLRSGDVKPILDRMIYLLTN